MSIIKNSGLKQAHLATERGWETHDGKLVISSRNLLTNRVLQNLATAEEVKRWSEAQLIEIESRKNKVLSTLEINETRLATLNAKFEETNAELQNSEKTEDHIQYHLRKVEHLKTVLEYEKSFNSIKQELERLNIRKDKVQSKLNTVLAVVPSLTESPSEKKIVSSETIPSTKQEDKPNKPVQPEKIKVQEKKERKKPGPKPGFKERLAEKRRLAAEKASAEKAAQEAGTTNLEYPLPESESIPD